MRGIKVGTILIGIFALNLSLPVNAAVYKCEDASGHISYSQVACPEEAKIDKILKLSDGGFGAKRHVQCGLVNSFAAEVGIAMNNKRSVSEIIDGYGGVGGLSPVALKIIRSVYEYQSQPYRTVENSVSHERERCRSEVYGVTDCSQFPMAFISNYGSCEAAADTNSRIKRMAESSSDDKLRNDTQSTTQRVAAATASAQTRNAQRVQQCRESVQQDIQYNKAMAREAQGGSAQDSLRAEQRALREKLSRCGR